MSAAPAPRVFVLHGVWMHAPVMAPFAAALRRQGFAARTLGYASLFQPAEAVLARLAHTLRAHPGCHVVAHSLGGLLALCLAQQGLELGRLVCLGTPLCGSAAARRLRGSRAGRVLLGSHCRLLAEGVSELPPGLSVGMIAGTRRRGLGQWLAPLPGAHDGTVAVAETRLPGLAAHCLVPASHSGLVFSARAMQQAVAFLQSGHFLPAEAPQAA